MINRLCARTLLGMPFAIAGMLSVVVSTMGETKGFAGHLGNGNRLLARQTTLSKSANATAQMANARAMHDRNCDGVEPQC